MYDPEALAMAEDVLRDLDTNGQIKFVYTGDSDTFPEDGDTLVVDEGRGISIVGGKILVYVALPED